MTDLSRMEPGETFPDYFYRISAEFAQMTEEEKSALTSRYEQPARQKSTQQKQATDGDRKS